MTNPVPESVPSRPRGPGREAATACEALFTGFSLDITSRELGELVPAPAVIPAGTPVQLAFPDGADLAERVSTARAIKEALRYPAPVIIVFAHSATMITTLM
jgi:hypothetical protein